MFNVHFQSICSDDLFRINCVTMVTVHQSTVSERQMNHNPSSLTMVTVTSSLKRPPTYNWSIVPTKGGTWWWVWLLNDLLLSNVHNVYIHKIHEPYYDVWLQGFASVLDLSLNFCPQAERPLSAGSVIIVEKPYAAVLLPSHADSHCHHCFRPLLVVVPLSDS